MKSKAPCTFVLLLAGSFFLLGLSSINYFYPAEIPAVTIGSQTWMAVNLATDVFRNGERIEHATSPAAWSRCGDQKRACWCYYNFDAKYGELYGKLYNWHAVNDPRGLAPNGWRVAAIEDWEILFEYVGGIELAGAKLKRKSDWKTPGTSTDEHLFSALPGGFINGFGNCHEAGIYGYWWSSTHDNELLAKSVDLYDAEDRGYISRSMKKEGLSVRCILE